jgi:YggT family protein
MLAPLILILGYVAWAIRIAALVVAVAILVRMLMQWAQANPFGWFAMKLRGWTEPFIRPFRHGFDNRMLRFDMIPFVAALLVLLNGFFAAYLVDRLNTIPILWASRPFSVALVLASLVSLAATVMLAFFIGRFLMQQFGFGYSSRFYRYVFQVTEPILKPFRRIFYFGGPFDFSAMFALLAVYLVELVLLKLLGF